MSALPTTPLRYVSRPVWSEDDGKWLVTANDERFYGDTAAEALGLAMAQFCHIVELRLYFHDPVSKPRGDGLDHILPSPRF